MEIVIGFHESGYSAAPQIRADRNYAATLFGDLKDPRAVPILVRLLSDEEVNYIVPWSLGEIGDKRAVAPLIRTLADKKPSMRVLAINALEKLAAKDALPALYRLLNDNEKSNLGDPVSVAEAAKAAIAKLEAH
jgi:HEAT repeat protein